MLAYGVPFNLRWIRTLLDVQCDLGIAELNDEVMFASSIHPPADVLHSQPLAVFIMFVLKALSLSLSLSRQVRVQLQVSALI